MAANLGSMKKILLSLGLVAALGAPATASAGSPIEGRWRNGKMEIEIGRCGQSLCGTVVKASPKAQSKAQKGTGTKLIGARLIDNIRATAEGRYKARVFLADRDMHATGTIRQLNDNQLAVRGCALLVICRSATWDRVR
ncbi:MAG TPA: DUF2147 domain-containing protein [Sphingomicrobium sp.]|nr:DUF2147 domain-containing protein [Sphingomicrobium sp.]